MRTDGVRPAAMLLASLLALAGGAAPAMAQCPREWASGFQVPGVNGPVYALTVFDDGRGPALYAGGLFTYAGPVEVRGVARWDGQQWSAVGTELWQTVYALAVYDDGAGPALYAGYSDGVHRWNGQNWLPAGGGTWYVAPVRCLAVHDDGTGPALYAGGDFTWASGVPANHIARWDGRAWSALGSGVSAGFYGGTVYALASLHDRLGPAIYVGGDFVAAGGLEAYGVARWDGTAWSALAELGVSSTVFSLATLNEAEGPALYVGGGFAYAGSVLANGIARYDGLAWSALGDGFPVGGPSALGVYDDGSGAKLIAAAFIGATPEAPGFALARWDGQSWTILDPAGNSQTYALTQFTPPDGTPGLYAGGDFTLAGRLRCANVARWDAAGIAPLGNGQGLAVGVAALAYHDDGRAPALFAGELTADPPRRRQVLRWANDGWTALPGYFDDGAAAMLSYDDGTGPALYVGGLFNYVGTLQVGGLARWDGQQWSAVGALDPGSYVGSLCVYDDGGGPLLYACGYGLRFPGLERRVSVATWDGLQWSALTSNLRMAIMSSAVFDDGRGPALYVCGIPLAGAPPGIARWDGTAWSDVGGGVVPPDEHAQVLLTYDDGLGPALYLGGDFHAVGGVAAESVARWDGTRWSPVGAGIYGLVSALAAFDDGSGPALYAGGWFDSVGGWPAHGIARWKNGQWSALGSGVYPTMHLSRGVMALAAGTSAGRPILVTGGEIDTAGGHASGGVAIWQCAPNALAGDTNCDGSVTWDDISPFVLVLTDRAKFEREHPGCPWLNADCSGNGLVDFGDINPFVALLTRTSPP